MSSLVWPWSNPTPREFGDAANLFALPVLPGAVGEGGEQGAGENGLLLLTTHGQALNRTGAATEHLRAEALV